MVKRVWLLLAGEFAAPVWPIAAGDIVIAVDGGMRHADRLRVQPTFWIGDFDSSDPALCARYSEVPRKRFPVAKAATDFELALDYARSHYPTALLSVIGADGGEPDHLFANFWVLPRTPRPVVLWLRDAVAVAGRSPIVRVQGAPGAKVSLFALQPLSDVTYHGLRFPLDGARLAPHLALAARNELVARNAELRWQGGYGLLFLPRSVASLSVCETDFSRTSPSSLS